MFEQVVTQTAARLGLPADAVSSLLSGLLTLMTSETAGGIESFVDRFRTAGLGSTFSSWLGGSPQKMTESQLESVLGSDTINRLATSSGLTRPSAASALTELLPSVVGRLAPGGVMPPNNALLSQLSGYVHHHGASMLERMEHEETSSWRRFLPWAAVVLLALGAWLIFRGSSNEPQLTLSNRDGRVTYSGVVRDESTRTAIENALRAAFGGNLSGELRVDRDVKGAAWVPRIQDIVAAAKQPGADLSLRGDTVNIGGWLSASDRQSLTDSLRGVLGGSATFGALGDAAMEAARAANDKAVSALRAIGTSGVQPDSVVQAMNLAVINFPTGSSEIPADSMEVIRQSADVLKRAPSGSRIEIGGHTDNTGDPATNLTLSEARAESVKRALVSAGAPDGILMTKGYGDSTPRASNENEYGRFQNRRIEYKTVQ